MTAIYKREMRSYLTSPVGYVFLAVFFAISGYYFFATSLVSNTTDMSYVFSNLFSIVIFLVPMLTMRLFSEERKQKTEQALFTAPVGFPSIVMGKFLASLSMYTLGMGITLAYFLVMCLFQVPDLAVFCGNFLGLFLLGAALCAIGTYISSLTENQVIAAVGSLAIGMLLLFINSFTPVISSTLVMEIMDGLSFYQHYLDFTRGLLNLSDFLCQHYSAVFVFDSASSGTPACILKNDVKIDNNMMRNKEGCIYGKRSYKKEKALDENKAAEISVFIQYYDGIDFGSDCFGKRFDRLYYRSISGDHRPDTGKSIPAYRSIQRIY